MKIYNYLMFFALFIMANVSLYAAEVLPQYHISLCREKDNNKGFRAYYIRSISPSAEYFVGLNVSGNKTAITTQKNLPNLECINLHSVYNGDELSILWNKIKEGYKSFLLSRPTSKNSKSCAEYALAQLNILISQDVFSQKGKYVLQICRSDLAIVHQLSINNNMPLNHVFFRSFYDEENESNYKDIGWSFEKTNKSMLAVLTKDVTPIVDTTRQNEIECRTVIKANNKKELFTYFNFIKDYYNQQLSKISYSLWGSNNGKNCGMVAKDALDALVNHYNMKEISFPFPEINGQNFTPYIGNVISLFSK